MFKIRFYSEIPFYNIAKYKDNNHIELYFIGSKERLHFAIHDYMTIHKNLRIEEIEER